MFPDYYEIKEYENENLDELLKNNYPEIFDSLSKDYILEYLEFDFLREIKSDGKVVGFISLKQLKKTEKRLSIEECYIIPEFRHNNLLYSELLKLASIPTVYLYARRPNWAFMKVMIKNDLVEDMYNKILGCGIEFIIDSDEIYTNDEIIVLYDLSTPINDFFSEYVYDEKNRLLFVQDMWNNVSINRGMIAIVKPRLSDLNKINYEKILKKFTIEHIDKISEKLFYKHNDIENCFGLWESKVWQYNNLDKIIGKPHKLNHEMIDLLKNEGLDESVGFEILYHIKDANKKVQLKEKYNIFRRNYLLKNSEMIKKEVNFNLYDDGKCPFCEHKRVGYENCIYCGFDFENFEWYIRRSGNFR